jgi:aspartyl-tRNA(Asn)/glutamyl-tRNA(Gln) amidotransferase subunit A
VDARTDGRAYAAAREVVLAFQREVAAAFGAVDLLLTPTMRVVPPERGELDPAGDMSPILGNTAPFSASGNPAVSVPAGTVDGVPVGAQVVAPRFADRRALVGAHLVERVTR